MFGIAITQEDLRVLGGEYVYMWVCVFSLVVDSNMPTLLLSQTLIMIHIQFLLSHSKSMFSYQPKLDVATYPNLSLIHKDLRRKTYSILKTNVQKSNVI